MAQKEPIAIIGTACRFPGSIDTPSKLERFLRDPSDLQGEIAPWRLNLSQFQNENANHHGCTTVKMAYMLSDDIRDFDAAFFNINAQEAEAMDPQQRLLLEVVYEALEASGHGMQDMSGSRTSVFVGCMNGDYYDMQIQDLETVPKYLATGTARSMLSNRISHLYNLKGPSVTVDTACSSSMVAVHDAVESIRAGSSDMAIVGAANLILAPEMFVSGAHLGFLSPTARSRMWDAAADGYARGEGVVAVVLKPLATAIADGDAIESVIRATAVNSDGWTSTLTTPSADEQAKLIRDTYASVGLDPTTETERCQYYEAHGTGTRTGDPIEAEAIYSVFFAGEQASGRLPVGSIKTLVGHTETCAGLAGILKASIAVQKGFIPPNLLFSTPNPAVQPFLGRLEVPLRARPWPAVRPGQPRRASVGSYGFGGTNGHLILESYEPPGARLQCPGGAPQQLSTPLVFSANSRFSLMANVRHFAEYLQQQQHDDDSASLADVAWTLQCRRSTLPFRIAFAQPTKPRLVESMAARVAGARAGGLEGFGTRRSRESSAREGPAILGIFTGQGAQWAGMGRELLHTNACFRGSIRQCDEALAALPEAPGWSIADELAKNAAANRLGVAEIASPVVTALQLALVDLARAAGIVFAGVVGHSSGEVAALYAAGVLSLRHAMQIAWYKGFVAKLGPARPGAMAAVGMGRDAADIFCSQPRFAGRIVMAAHNAPDSVTLAGDADAIDEAAAVLAEQGVFVRRLRVDRAYHSHHVEPVLPRLRECITSVGVDVRAPSPACPWISTLHGDDSLLHSGGLEALAGQYWCDAAVRPVLFADAVAVSLYAAGPFDLAVEVGPHAALKGPVTATVTAALGVSFPYVGLLSRGADSVQAMAAALGAVWEHLGPDSGVDLDAYRRTFATAVAPRLVPGLPPYFWDRGRFWHESRLSRNRRLRDGAFHPLLGRRCPDDSDRVMRWRNMLHLDELPWLRGHGFQGSVLFPMAGHIAYALEAALCMCRALRSGTAPEAIAVEELQSPKALTLAEGSAGVESVVSLQLAPGDVSDAGFAASFSCEMCAPGPNAVLERYCTARVRVICADNAPGAPTTASAPDDSLAAFDPHAFYAHMDRLGLHYGGPFRAIKAGSRAADRAHTLASWPRSDLSGGFLLVHPAVLDVSLQATLAALHPPGSVRLRHPVLPVGADRVLVRPRALQPKDKEDKAGDKLTAEAHAAMAWSSFRPVGHVRVIVGGSGECGVDVQSIRFKGFEEALPADDAALFYKTHWEPDVASVALSPAKADACKIEALQRIALFHVRSFVDAVPDDELPSFRWYHRRMAEYYKRLVKDVAQGRRDDLAASWLHDRPEEIDVLYQQWGQAIDARLATAVGRALLAVCRGERDMLEVMMEDDMLGEMYSKAIGAGAANSCIASLARHIVHRYPRMHILEAGAGTAGTTASILDAVGDDYASYTFTDISVGFFERSEERLGARARRMSFKVLDIEKPIAEQGFEQGAYDLVVAANVVHATRSLHDTLANIRTLLKPGGYLLLVEITGDPISLFDAMIYGGLEQWWTGAADGRCDHPGATHDRWHRELCGAGFTGLDQAVVAPASANPVYSVIRSQAVDDVVLRLRDPLAPQHTKQPLAGVEQLLVVASKKNALLSLVADEVCHRLAACGYAVGRICSLDERIRPGTSAIVLCELEQAFLTPPVSEARLGALKVALSSCRDMLWVTRRCRDPYAAMLVGIQRALFNEMPHVNLQLLDLDNRSEHTASHLCEHFLRLITARVLQADSGNRLWTNEPEIAVWDGRLMVPRIVPDGELNARLNSTRRLILERASADCPRGVELRHEGRYAFLAYRDTPKEQQEQPRCVRVKTTFSMAHPLPGTAAQYVCVGRNYQTGERLVALAPVSGSLLDVDARSAARLEGAPYSDEHALFAVFSGILARLFSTLAPAGGHVLVVDPDEAVASLLAQLDPLPNVILASSAFPTQQGPLQSIFIPAACSEAALRERIPPTVVAVVDMATGDPDPNPNPSARLGSWLPYFKYPVLLHPAGESLPIWLKEVLEQLRRAPLRPPLPQSCHAIAANNVYEQRGLPWACALDWTAPAPCKVRVMPLEQTNLFRSDRTYLLAGFSSDLGLSVARWMVDQGARHVAVASRNPQVPSAFVRQANARGAQVQVLKMDVTQQASVSGVSQALSSTMPPVAGICHGAMTLCDRVFSEMTAGELNQALAPKMEGGRNLDAVFSDVPLDFFIMLSSVACIIGNVAQTNYHAGNMFLVDLAARRQARGRAASVIHLALVAGVGYVARQGLTKELEKTFVPVQEEDVHLAFAEAIHAGRSGSAHGPEIICGMKRVTRREVQAASGVSHWSRNPRFAGLVDAAPAATAAMQRADAGGPGADMREALQGIEAEADAAAIVLQGLLQKLAWALRQAPGALDPHVPVSRLGLDSVLAVEIRFWFLKTIQVEVPILKIIECSADGLSRLAARQLLDARREAHRPGDSDVPGRKTHGDSNSSSNNNNSGQTHADDTEKAVALGDPVVSGAVLRSGTIPPASNVFVCGATGSQGGAVARQLLAHGYFVRCVTRQPDSAAARTLRNAGAHVFAGDFDDQESLARAMQSSVAAFVNVHPGWHDPGARLRHVQNICAAARRAGTVRMLVYSSVRRTGDHGQDTVMTPGRKKLLEPTWEMKKQCEAAIEAAGVERWTIIRPSTFMKNFLLPIAPLTWPGLVEKRIFKTALHPDVCAGLSNEEDMAKFALMALQDPDRFHGKRVDWAGDHLTPAQVAIALANATGCDFSVEFYSDEEKEVIGETDPLIASQLYLSAYPEAPDPQLREKWGVQTTSFMDYLKERETQVRLSFRLDLP